MKLEEFGNGGLISVNKMSDNELISLQKAIEDKLTSKTLSVSEIRKTPEYIELRSFVTESFKKLENKDCVATLKYNLTLNKDVFFVSDLINAPLSSELMINIKSRGKSSLNDTPEYKEFDKEITKFLKEFRKLNKAFNNKFKRSYREVFQGDTNDLLGF